MFRITVKSLLVSDVIAPPIPEVITPPIEGSIPLPINDEAKPIPAKIIPKDIVAVFEDDSYLAWIEKCEAAKVFGESESDYSITIEDVTVEYAEIAERIAATDCVVTLAMDLKEKVISKVALTASEQSDINYALIAMIECQRG